MTDRRYSDEEVRRIFALAAEAEEAAGAERERPWTLGEVERIGTEAGLSPQAVTAAAMALEGRPGGEVAGAEPGRYFGLPVTVSRAVPLSRRLSDDDWEQLVSQLRETFAAEGRTRVAGARREWRVGNLRVTHEPAGDGALLRLRTRKGDARVYGQMGVMLLLVAATAAVVAMVGTPEAADAKRMAVAWLAGLMGLLLLVVGALRLPAWARVRSRQFDALASFARRIAAS